MNIGRHAQLKALHLYGMAAAWNEWRAASSAQQKPVMPLTNMCLFMLNTGLRDQELCSLKWENECKVQDMDTTVFIITEETAKNGCERMVPLNSIAPKAL